MYLQILSMHKVFSTLCAKQKLFYSSILSNLSCMLPTLLSMSTLTCIMCVATPKATNNLWCHMVFYKLSIIG